jgi:hypothetical protein
VHGMKRLAVKRQPLTASLFQSQIAISASNCERFDVPLLQR